jgi:competence protein ComEC
VAAGLSIDFVDVGQGDCSVIHLPDGGFILIDVGPKNSPIVNWLSEPNQMRRRCHAIVITHNDADHCGALSSVLDLQRGHFGKLYTLVDRPKDDAAFQLLFRKALELRAQRRLEMERLEVGHPPVWEDGGLRAKLTVMFPDYAQNVAAPTANSTSGVLALWIDSKVRIIWSGDSHIESVSLALPGSNPKWLAGPHHGAPSDWHDVKSPVALSTFMPERAFISVGTSNQFSHPKPAFVRALKNGGCRVACSQITRQCHPGAAQTGFVVVNGNPLHGYLPALKGNPCRGATRTTFDGTDFSPDRWDRLHRQKVLTLRRAMCL